MAFQARFRTDYEGEFVVINTTYSGGKRHEEREWIPNSIQNYHISGRAAVIGDSTDRELFDHRRLQYHKGGLRGQLRLQTYGVGSIWRDMVCDFALTTERSQIQEMVDQKYDERVTVYTSSRLCIDYAGHFYLIPYAPVMDNLASALYLAAFDGHKEIYMLGYNKTTAATTHNWVRDVNTVIAAYPGVKFYLIGAESNMPNEWRYNNNVRVLSYRQFISYCDI